MRVPQLDLLSLDVSDKHVFFFERVLQTGAHLSSLVADSPQLIHVGGFLAEGLLEVRYLALKRHAVVLFLAYLPRQALLHIAKHFFLSPQTSIYVEELLVLLFKLLLHRLVLILHLL